MSKKEINWQPIDKLPIFIALVEKMLHDTQQKLDKLKAAKKAIYSISDGELSEMMHVFHRQLDNHASLVGQFNRWLLDAKHLHERQLIKAILKRNAALKHQFANPIKSMHYKDDKYFSSRYIYTTN